MTSPRWKTRDGHTVPASPAAFDKFKPFFDRRVKVRAVTCPTCGAEPGEPCAPHAHSARRKVALRQEMGWDG